MAIAERGAAEAAQRIADALEAAGLPHAIGGALALDGAYVRRWIVEMMGESDERVLTWDSLVARFGAAGS